MHREFSKVSLSWWWSRRPPPGVDEALEARRLKLSDAMLVKAASTGDESAFVALYRRHARSANQTARRHCRRAADADDAVAAAFVRVFKVVSAGGTIRQFDGYLRRAVHHEVIDQARRVRLELVPFDDIDIVERATLDEPVGAAMAAALRSLPERQFAALWRTEVDGASSQDVAQSMQLGANAFAALKARAKRNLFAAFRHEQANSARTPREMVGGALAT